MITFVSYDIRFLRWSGSSWYLEETISLSSHESDFGKKKKSCELAIRTQIIIDYICNTYVHHRVQDINQLLYMRIVNMSTCITNRDHSIRIHVSRYRHPFAPFVLDIYEFFCWWNLNSNMNMQSNWILSQIRHICMDGLCHLTQTVVQSEFCVSRQTDSLFFIT